jgi:hypothetical protein
MKMFPLPGIITFIVFLGLSAKIAGQPIVSNATPSDIILNLNGNEPGAQKVKDFYYKSISTPIEILNGKEYINYFFRGKTSPLLFSNQLFNSTLIFNKRTYSNVNLQYDTYLDEVLYTDTSKIISFEFPRIALNKELVDGFSFYFRGEFYNFRHLSFQVQSKNSLSDGFYDLVYDGPSMFIIKHRSSLYERDAVIEYKYSPIKYVFIEGAFRKFVSLKDFIGLFGSREEEIREYLHDNRIRIRNTSKDVIAGILKHYDSIAR